MSNKQNCINGGDDADRNKSCTQQMYTTIDSSHCAKHRVAYRHVATDNRDPDHHHNILSNSRYFQQKSLSKIDVAKNRRQKWLTSAKSILLTIIAWHSRLQVRVERHLPSARRICAISLATLVVDMVAMFAWVDVAFRSERFAPEYDRCLNTGNFTDRCAAFYYTGYALTAIFRFAIFAFILYLWLSIPRVSPRARIRSID